MTLTGFEPTTAAGLPALVGQLPGPVRGALVFRAGQADEPLARRGLTHLVEHLALRGGPHGERVGGTVDLLTTVFTAEGPPEAVAARLREIAAALGALDVGGLEAERRVLGVEGLRRLPHAGGALLWAWYGARGPGVTAYEELGLRAAGPDTVREHARRWFCRGNAALVLSAPVTGLDELALAPGPRRPPVPAPEVGHDPLPGALPMPGGVALGAPVEAGPPGVLLAAVLERRLWDVLREVQGLAYDVDCRAIRVDGDRRLLVVTCDAADRDAEAVVAATMAEVAALAGGACAADELDRARERLIARADDDGGFLAAVAVAGGGLVTGEPLAPSAAVARLGAATADEVRTAARGLAGRMLAVVPPGSAAGTLPPAERRVAAPAQGAVHPRRTVPRHLDAPVSVTVGRDRVTATDAAGAATVAYAECVAGIRGLDGALTLIGADGTEVRIDPADVRDGAGAVARVQAALDPAVLVPLGEAEAHLAQVTAGRLRPLVVGEAPELLAPLLATGERVRLAVEGSAGMRSGVLALTDRRLLFVAKLLSEHVEAVPLTAITAMKLARNPLWPAVTVSHDGASRRYTFMTVPRAREFAVALREAVAAARGRSPAR